MARPSGVLPDDVIRDYRANAFLVFVDLRDDLSGEQAQEWLRRVTEIVQSAVEERQRRRLGPWRFGSVPVTSITVGLGPTFFFRSGVLRFGLAPEQIPAGFAALPDLKAETPAAHDLVFYVMTTSEEAAARFLRSLEGTRSIGLMRITLERGFQRFDRREAFGFRDGLRNAQGRRDEVSFVDREFAPDEPRWAEGGSYLVYLKIEQFVDQFDAQPDKEQMIGRRMTDGSRLDLAEGTQPKNEGPFTGPMPTETSHVRKAGPRGEHDRVEIFRRGVPYAAITPEGRLEVGLQFVSFQWSLDRFDTVYRRWMHSPDFPRQGVGADDLLRRGVIAVRKGGVFFVPPSGKEFIGAGIFDLARPGRRARRGRLIVRKSAENLDGSPAFADLTGVAFELRRPDGTAATAPFRTDSAGHAFSELVEAGTYTLHETPTANLEPLEQDKQVTIERRSQLVRSRNRVRQPIYGG